MEAWIKALIEFVASPIRSLLNAVVARFSSMWAVVTGFYTKVRDSLTRWVNTGRGWAGAVRRHAQQVYVTLRWLITDYAPRLASNAFNDAVRWAGAELGALRDDVRSTFASVLQWARSQLNTLVDFLNRLVDWADAQVSALIDRARRLEDHVFGVLATPERLAAWAVGAIAAALLRYLLDQAVPVGRVLWRSRVPVALESAHLIEDIITRII